LDHRDQAIGGRLRIGQLAALAGVSVKTIRFYEERDILPQPRRADNDYRIYAASDVERLLFVRGARSLGLSLDDIKEVLAFKERGEAPCRYVLGLLEEKISQIEGHVLRLQQLRDELLTLVEEGSQLPTDQVDMKECVCHLIRNQSAASGRKSGIGGC
jgi:DNA-binding transcriptional MerR regulator